MRGEKERESVTRIVWDREKEVLMAKVLYQKLCRFKRRDHVEKRETIIA